ncbi:MAG: aldo/keto reductase [Hyphomonas sp.]
MIEHPDAGHLATVLSRPTGPLGFGCGQLADAGDAAAAARLLEAAFDNGITYFDTARLYAEGRAEGILGEVFKDRRDQVIIASKAGILPASVWLTKRVTDKAVRTARRLPGLQSILPEPAPVHPTFNVFDRPRLQASVETSLRELKTDYLDVLLLHECQPEHAADEAVRAFADDLVRQGKVRAYGIAPRIDDALAIEQQGVAFGKIVQVASSAWQDTVSRLPPRADRLLITHSVLGQPFRDTLQKLRADEAAAASWRAALDIDPTDPQALARLILGHALQANPSGLVLFSTTNPDRIAHNMRAAQAPLPEAQVNQLAGLLAEL